MAFSVLLCGSLGMDLRGKQLVIFGCGYVGTALALRALDEGLRVTALTRSPSKADALRELRISQVVQADIHEAGWEKELPAKSDFVVNCLSSGGGDLVSYKRTYLEGMRRILSWAECQGVAIGTLLYTGSTGIYPQCEGETVDETSPLEPADARSGILREAEDLLWRQPVGISRWFILRLAGIYGPGRHHVLDQVRSGAASLPGSGDYRMNMAHRDDIVSAILACLSAPPAVRNEIFNVADGRPATKTEVVRWLCSQLGRTEPEFSGEGGSGKRPSGPADRIILSRKLTERLGWKPEYPTYLDGYARLLTEV